MKDTIWIKKGRFTPLAVVLMFAFPLVTALICLCFGRMNVPVGEVLTALRTALTGGSTSNVQNYSIVINLRLPRILMAIIVGAGLSCAGNTCPKSRSNTGLSRVIPLLSMSRALAMDAAAVCI